MGTDICKGHMRQGGLLRSRGLGAGLPPGPASAAFSIREQDPKWRSWDLMWRRPLSHGVPTWQSIGSGFPHSASVLPPRSREAPELLPAGVPEVPRSRRIIGGGGGLPRRCPVPSHLSLDQEHQLPDCTDCTAQAAAEPPAAPPARPVTRRSQSEAEAGGYKRKINK